MLGAGQLGGMAISARNNLDFMDMSSMAYSGFLFPFEMLHMRDVERPTVESSREQ